MFINLEVKAGNDTNLTLCRLQAALLFLMPTWIVSYIQSIYRINTLHVGTSYIVVPLTVYNTRANCQECQSL
jgi:hypothetical protein